MQISLRQPWATLISTGIVRTIYLNAHPDTVPGRYSVFAERPEEGDSFSQEILQEMINHSLFGNIDTTHLPVEMNIGEVFISECVPVQRRNGIVYRCLITESTESCSSVRNRQTSGKGLLRVPRLCGHTLVMPMCKRVLNQLSTDYLLKVEMTDDFRNSVCSGEGQSIKSMICVCNNKYRFFYVNPSIIKRRNNTDYMVLQLKDEFIL